MRFGADARIVLDAYPNVAIPAKVSFIATPGAVHAEDGRDPERARQADVPHPGAHRPGAGCAARPDAVRSGLPGVAYIRTDPAVQWPDRLQVSAAAPPN